MNVYVRSLSSALARAGMDCDVYTRAWRRGLSSVVTVEPGFRVHHVRAGPVAPVPKEEMLALAGEFADGVLTRARAQGEPDLIHANYWLSGVSGHALKHELDVPLVCTFHTLALVKALDDPAVDGEQREAAEAEVVGCSDAILASSDDERAQLERLYGAAEGRVEVVPPGVDHDLFGPGDRAEARAALGLGAGPVLLFVGRIQPLKGVDVAIEATARSGPDACLLVVGGPSGPHGTAERRRLGGLVDALGMRSRVRFVPPQPHARLATYYRAADACLVPSRSESFGLVALEAAACGTPVVAARVGGLQTLVEHAATGFLVDGPDAAAFASWVTELLADPAGAAAMGAAAVALARRYSWSITAARMRRLCADLTARDRVECR
jgi:D-inositol-3-phosphate glycosyltransferase